MSVFGDNWEEGLLWGRGLYCFWIYNWFSERVMIAFFWWCGVGYVIASIGTMCADCIDVFGI